MTINEINSIVISSRIRLARNVKGYNFPHKLTQENAIKLKSELVKGILNVGNFNYYNLKSMQELDVLTMVENGYISQELVKNKEISGMMQSSDDTVCIMINEEDHLREQCIMEGLNLKKAYDIINDIDSEIGKFVNFSYDEKLGFITACPSNLGTGMRASAMLFLPALCKTGNIESVINTVSKLGICVRGSGGEGTKAQASMFQVSNQSTLGKSEKEILQLVESTVIKIVELELQAREILMNNSFNDLKDEVLRAYGVLSNCHKISMQEFYSYFEKVKMGQDMGVITLNNDNNICEIINNCKPFNLSKKENKNLNSLEVDLARAELLNSYFKNMRI